MGLGGDHRTGPDPGGGDQAALGLSSNGFPLPESHGLWPEAGTTLSFDKGLLHTYVSGLCATWCVFRGGVLNLANLVRVGFLKKATHLS